MKKITGQTIYQCEFCNKRLLTKAGAVLHENHYCSHERSPNKKNIQARQEVCKHENYQTEYSTIPGECVGQPECYVCLDCGKRL